MCSRTFCCGLKEKYSFLENTRFSLQPHAQSCIREEPMSQDKLVFQNQCSQGSDSKKAVNRSYRISLPTAVFPTSRFILFVPGTFFLLFLKINIFVFMGHVMQIPLRCIASNVCLNQIFISFYSDIRGLLRSQVYLRHLTDFFQRHLILRNAIS